MNDIDVEDITDIVQSNKSDLLDTNRYFVCLCGNMFYITIVSKKACTYT